MQHKTKQTNPSYRRDTVRLTRRRRAAQPAETAGIPLAQAEAQDEEEAGVGHAEPVALLSDTTLARYFREVATHDLLSAQEEQTVMRRIEELELLTWERLLSCAAAVERVLQVIEECTGIGKAEFQAVRSAARQAQKTATGKRTDPAHTRRLQLAARRAGERIYKLDADRSFGELVIARLRAEPLPRGMAGLLFEAEEANREAREARAAFVRANLRLVISVARRYRRDLLSFDDLIQEGNIGLLKGVVRYDYRRGVKFSTYASWWIRHAINRALADKGRQVRLPVHLLGTQYQMAKAERTLDSTLGRAPTTEELAAATKIPAAKIDQIRSMVRERPFSLDRPFSGDGEGDRDLLETFQDPNHQEPSPLEGVMTREMGRRVERIMNEVLKPIEKDILRRRFGFGEEDELTLKVIGERYQLSRERIRQLEAQALEKIRLHLKEAE